MPVPLCSLQSIGASPAPLTPLPVLPPLALPPAVVDLAVVDDELVMESTAPISDMMDELFALPPPCPSERAFWA